MNNLMKRENFDFIPRDISGTGQNLFTKLDLEKPFVSVDDIIENIDNRFKENGFRKISFHDQDLKKTNIRVSPWFDLDQNSWYKMNISLLKEKKYRKPQLLYIGLCEGESNTVRNRLNRFFRAVNDQQYESEHHQAGVATKKLLDSYGITVYDSDKVEFFVELCEVPKFIHNISPRDIESFMIKRAKLNGAPLLMNLKS